MVAAPRRVDRRVKRLQERVVKRQHAAGVGGGFRGLVVKLPRYELEHLVDRPVVHRHRLLGIARQDQVGQGKLPAGQFRLDGVAEADLVLLVPPAGSPLELEFSRARLDDQLGRPPAAAAELLQRLDYPNVVVREDDGQLVAVEDVVVITALGAVASRARPPGAGRRDGGRRLGDGGVCGERLGHWRQ